MEDWEELVWFPGYSISNCGRVRNDSTDRLMSLSLNQHGIVQVGLMRNGRQYKRSVTVLVANAFLPKPSGLDAFDTPIHLDGDRTNNDVHNMMWRPLWFAVRYHAQFGRSSHMRIVKPIHDLATGKVYQNSFEAAITHGILEREIALSVINGTHVFPTFQRFAFHTK